MYFFFQISISTIKKRIEVLYLRLFLKNFKYRLKVTDRFSVLLNALRRANLEQDVVVDVVQQQLAVVEHVVLFRDRFEEKSVGEAVQQSVTKIIYLVLINLVTPKA